MKESGVPSLIEVTDAPSDSDRAALLDGLRAYNLAAGGITMRQVAVWVRDDDGTLTGGLTGRTGGGWLFIEYFWLSDRLRGKGLGSDMIRRVEEVAKERGCIGVWLDTFSFQAPDFYKRHGYEVFGTIEDYPVGSRRHFMQKRLDRPAA